MILSVSRRTDIPAFFPKWFINRVREGFVYVKNPFNANQISRIPLGKDIVDCIVFWSKNPEPLLKYFPEIDEMYQGAFYFQFTINAYGKDLEPNVIDLEKRIETFLSIAERYGSEKVIWRYDPILITDRYSLEWHVERFRAIFERLKDCTDTCVISFIDMYNKTKNNTKSLGIRAPERFEIDIISSELSRIVQGSAVNIKTCAEGVDLMKYGIQHNSCIDQHRIEKITGFEIKAKADKQRDCCLCIECADIGLYNTCLHGCRYCYANFNTNQVRKAVEEHDDMSPLLTGSLTPSCVIKDYSKAKSLKVGPLGDNQISMF